jgi:hypothetical protein
MIRFFATAHERRQLKKGIYQPFGFAGRLYDEDTGFTAFGRRDYAQYEDVE